MTIGSPIRRPDRAFPHLWSCRGFIRDYQSRRHHIVGGRSPVLQPILHSLALVHLGTRAVLLNESLAREILCSLILLEEPAFFEKTTFLRHLILSSSLECFLQSADICPSDQLCPPAAYRLHAHFRPLSGFAGPLSSCRAARLRRSAPGTARRRTRPTDCGWLSAPNTRRRSRTGRSRNLHLRICCPFCPPFVDGPGTV